MESRRCTREEGQKSFASAIENDPRGPQKCDDDVDAVDVGIHDVSGVHSMAPHARPQAAFKRSQSALEPLVEHDADGDAEHQRTDREHVGFGRRELGGSGGVQSGHRNRCERCGQEGHEGQKHCFHLEHGNPFQSASEVVKTVLTR